MNHQLILKVLRAAKPRLNDAWFVCTAATDARKAGRITVNEEEEFHAFINERIEGHYTVTSWLERNGFPGATDASCEDKLAYRHRWIDAMIAEMEEKINTRQRYVRVLNAIKPLISESCPFVCHAVAAACKRGLISDFEAEQFKEMINERLQGRFTVHEWLTYRAKVEIDPDTWDRYRVEYRHRWVDAMIAEFSA